MNNRERRIYDMLSRVENFGRTPAGSFPDGSLGGELFADLAGVIEELNRNAGQQASHTSAAVQGTTSRGAARDALYEDLLAISRTARAMSFVTPGLEDRFRLPRGNRNDQLLLSTARAFLADAEPLKADFIRHELPADFLEDLRDDVEEFERASASQNNSRNARVNATSAIEAAIERGINIVRRLDAIIRNKFRDDPATLAAWTSASHTERAARASKTSQPAAPTGQTP